MGLAELHRQLAADKVICGLMICSSPGSRTFKAHSSSTCPAKVHPQRVSRLGVLVLGFGDFVGPFELHICVWNHDVICANYNLSKAEQLLVFQFVEIGNYRRPILARHGGMTDQSHLTFGSSDNDTEHFQPWRVACSACGRRHSRHHSCISLPDGDLRSLSRP